MKDKSMDTATIKSILIPLQDAERVLRNFGDLELERKLMEVEMEIVMKYDGEHNQ